MQFISLIKAIRLHLISGQELLLAFESQGK